MLNFCGKLSRMDWEALYRDPGLRWELIQSRTGPQGERLPSLHVTQKFRVVDRRSGEFLELITLYPIHDSAY